MVHKQYKTKWLGELIMNISFNFCIPFPEDYFQHGVLPQDDNPSIENAGTGASLIQKTWAKFPGQHEACLKIKTKDKLKHKQHILFKFVFRLYTKDERPKWKQNHQIPSLSDGFYNQEFWDNIILFLWFPLFVQDIEHTVCSVNAYPVLCFILFVLCSAHWKTI